ncbi:MAG: hypothetical protein PHX51_05055 [Clostridia bacterium]|nr:hypothetical protein [Clostridia bacterium]
MKNNTFADNIQLLNAYNSLRSEYTRKCQLIGELEKKLSELVPDFATDQTSAKQSDMANNALGARETNAVAKTSLETSPSLPENAYIKADSASEQSADGNLAQIEQQTEETNDYTEDKSIALIKAAVADAKNGAAVMELVNGVLRAYVEEIASKNPPRTISGTAAGFALTPKSKPKSLSELSDVAEEYFKALSRR